MARYFPRTPGGLAPSPLSADAVQSGQEMEERMRRLVAKQMAPSFNRGTSLRGGYRKDAPATKPELWQTVGVIPSAPKPGSTVHQTILPGGIHSNPYPRGAAHVRSNSQDKSRRRRSNSATALSRPSATNPMGAEEYKPRKAQEKKVVLGTVLGIYPAENKLPPGRSAADDFVATLAKRFQFGRKNSAGEEGPIPNPIAPNFGSSMAPPRPPRPETASPKPDAAPPTPNAPNTAGSAQATSRSQERQGRRVEHRGSSQRRRSKARSKSRRRELEQQPGPTNERVYAQMPLPAVPPSLAKTPPPPNPLPPQSDLKVDEKEQARKRAGLSFPPQYGIDIADWAESVYIFPKTPFSESPDPAAMADFPMPPLSPSLCGSLPEERRPSPPVPPPPANPAPPPEFSQISGHSRASSQSTKKPSRSPPPPPTDHGSTASPDTYRYDATTIASVSEDDMPTTAAPSIAAADRAFFAALELGIPAPKSTVDDDDYDYLDSYKHGFDDLEDYYTGDIQDHYYSSHEFIAPPAAVAYKKTTDRQPQEEKEALAAPSTTTKNANDIAEKKATKTTKAAVSSAQDLDAEIAAYLAEWRRIQQKEQEVAGGGPKPTEKKEGRQQRRDWERGNAKRVQLKPPSSSVSRRPSERLPPAYGAM